MKKMKFASLFMASALILAACGDSESTDNGGSSDTGEKYTLTVNNFEPAGANIDKNILSQWEKLVEEKTDGQVDVDVQHGAVLGPPTTIPQDLEAGLYDLGLVIANYAYDTKFFPYTISTLPFAAENSRQAAELLKAFAAEAVDKGQINLKVADPFTSDGYDLVSTEPIDVYKLKGLKMRASTAAESAFVQAIGGSPVGLKIGEAYEGLQKGTINTSFVSSTQMAAYRTYEVAPYIKRINFTYTPLIPALNQAFYDKLSDDLKKQFDEELMPALVQLGIDGFEAESVKQYEEIEKLVEGKGELTVATDEEMNHLRASSKASWESWIKDANDRGYDGEALVETYFKLLDEKNIPRPY